MSAELLIDSVWRYPVKGLAGERLLAAEVLAGRGICGDRRWMMASADVSPLLSGRKDWRPWNYGPSLKRNPRLSALRASLRDGGLFLQSQNSDEVFGNPETEEGKECIEKFLRRFFADDSIFLADCESRPVWDDFATPLTVLFAASVEDFSQKVGAPLSAERFRANIVVRGGEAMDEMNRFGEVLQLGEKTKLAAVEGVERCAATRVNPQTGARDINIPEQLMRNYRRNEMGIKCAIRSGGKVAIGDGVFWK